MINKISKKIAAIVSAAIIGSTLTTSLFSSANTYKTIWDNYYGDVCYVNNQSYHLYTVSDRKDNDSSIYFSNSGYYSSNGAYRYSTAPCSLYVYGYNIGDPYWVLNDVSTYRGRSLTTTGIYIEMGYTRLVRQYINEKGYNGARILIRNWEVGSSRGTWAPDSLSSEQYLGLAN